MSSLKIYNIEGAEVGEYDFPDSLMELKKGTQAVHDMVVARQAAARAGNASTKHKGEVAGSGKKPWKQKGTGRARAGYKQSPVWRGGAAAFGPKPRDYSVKVNKKVARLAFRRALSSKVDEGEIRVLDSISIKEPKTKQFAELLKSLKITGPALFILGDVDKNVALAVRNIPKVEVVKSTEANVYQLLRYPVLVADSAGMDQLKARLEGGADK